MKIHGLEFIFEILGSDIVWDFAWTTAVSPSCHMKASIAALQPKVL